ncbi:alpha/beta hydrolase [Aquicoccus sp. G2-2]|uniref:alpha/beta hydrolase n=1 Tax=Aquicoccus sp. G2-2 TaxID=3092120 RepID=UPI002ADF7711|nr:alpha/beta hydrolase [Aquicoccus sp. G2-2]MEA1112890.1 alpha/beta hydrolase [Aquicoccus sp. G2-2]
MLKTVAFLAVVAFGGVFGLARIERAALYPFDATRVAPEAVGVQAREEIFQSGGEKLVLWVARARAGKPVVLYFHGNAGNLAARAGRFDQFLARGFGLVALGYRGSSGSTGVPSERNIAFDAGRLLARVGDYAGAAPVVIYGESLGTGVALAAIERAGVQPAAVVLEAPFTDIRAVARHAEPKLEPLISQMKSEWNSLRRIKGLKAPLLVIHGSDDELIPIAMGRQVFDAAPGPDRAFIAVKGGHHTDLWRSDVLPRLWRFIDRFGGE